MTAIQVRKTAEEPGAASLAVTVPVEQVQEAEARATSAYQRRARLPGFRKGKAPAALVKKQFADDIRQQALEDLIRELESGARAGGAAPGRRPARAQPQVGRRGGGPGDVRVPRRAEARDRAGAHREVPPQAHRAQGHRGAGAGAAHRAARAEGTMGAGGG